MTSRANYTKELETVKKRITELSRKLDLNDKRIERGLDPGGFLKWRGLFLGAELARHHKRKVELLYILREKK